MPTEPLTRRRAVGGALGLAAAAVLPLPVRAAPPPGLAVPRVDALALTIVTDAATFGPFLPDLDRPGLRVHRAGNGGPADAPRMLPRALAGEFGLAILAESQAQGRAARVLVDFGYSREVLANNLGLLAIDPARLDAAVLSHGHLDHYGGFPGLFGAVRAGTAKLPLYVGGEETFCERVALIGTPPPVMGVLDRAALVRAGYEVRLAPAPAVVAGQAFTTGVIPLRSFERAAIPTRMRPGIGCERGALDPAKRTSGELPDDGEHELATCYAVAGLGLVIIASCSHRGVLNSIRQAQAISGIDKVHMVIGGFHLVRPRTDDEARRTVAELRVINPTWIVPGHCTGEVFIAEALRVMPEKVIRPYVGTRLEMRA